MDNAIRTARVTKYSLERVYLLLSRIDGELSKILSIQKATFGMFLQQGAVPHDHVGHVQCRWRVGLLDHRLAINAASELAVLQTTLEQEAVSVGLSEFPPLSKGRNCQFTVWVPEGSLYSYWLNTHTSEFYKGSSKQFSRCFVLTLGAFYSQIPLLAKDAAVVATYSFGLEEVMKTSGVLRG